MAEERFPQVEFFIGGKSLMVPPNHVTSFLYKDTIAMQGDAFTLEFVDPTWKVLDEDIIPSLRKNQSKPVSFRYGWGGERLSELRNGRMTEFIPSEITRGGIRIVMKGYDEGSASNSSQEKIEKLHEGNISDIVQEICTRNGWAADIEATKPIYELEGRTPGKKLKIWRQNAKTDLAFVNELAQRAKSASSAGAYRVFFDTETSPPTLHFHTERAQQFAIHREYVVQTDNLGEVLLFTPQVEGSAVVALGASNTSLVYKDPVTRRVEEKVATPSTFTEGVALGSRSAVEGGTTVRKVIPPATAEEAQARLDSFYEALSWAVSRATLEVLGDPGLKPGRLISVVVKTPQNQKYFISGIYLMETAVHNITPGNYVVTQDLIKNAFDVGDLPVAKGTVQRG